MDLINKSVSLGSKKMGKKGKKEKTSLCFGYTKDQTLAPYSLPLSLLVCGRKVWNGSECE